MEIEHLRESIRQIIERTDLAALPTINFVWRAKRGIETANQKLGIFPAFFDPLTKAHVEIIEEARKYPMDEILLVTDKRNADKETSEAPLEDRLLMLALFFEDDERVSIALSSHPLFLDKIRALDKIYPPATEVIFLVGYDTIVRILDKKYYRDRKAALNELFEKANFFVARRDDKGETALLDLFEKEENRKFKNKVKPLGISTFASSISATQVRERLKRGESVEELVPERISCVIKELKLYGGKEYG